MWTRAESCSPAAKSDHPPVVPSVAAHRTSDTKEKREGNVGRSVVVKGDLRAAEDLRIDGRVESRIEMPDHVLTIGPDANIQAVVIAKTVTVFGSVIGDITARDLVEIRRSGFLKGDLICARLTIQDGAHFCGKVEMRAKRRAQQTAETEKSLPRLIAS